MYAILDIETTGGKFDEEGITEIAIYKFDGYHIVDQFISFVNPEKEIQEFVVALTGISNEMLRNAPKFFEVAKRIVEITENCTIVAHNANFDYRILRTEFRRLGFDFDRNILCTVELSRKLISNQASYSLGKLTKSLGIPITNRHRASGDALATTQLFKLLLEKDVGKTIVRSYIKYFDNREIQEKLSKILKTIPVCMGVFYVYDKDEKVIYIGKGKNMKAALRRVFLKQSKRNQKIQERVTSVSCDKTGNNLFTQIKYYTELDILSPKFNFKRKRKPISLDFNHDNFIIIDQGREIEERAVILVENNKIVGYGYTKLAFQQNELDVLKSILTPLKDEELSKGIIKKYLLKNKVQKIVRF